MKDIDLIEIRHYLHQNPELSGNEIKTHQFLKKQLEQLSPDKLISHLGGHGLAVVFNDENYDKTIMFRCDIDALPIAENNTLPYTSSNENVAHLCGHDGHSAIMLGFAASISRKKDTQKQSGFAFQPAEETAQGAYAVLNDPKFKEIAPDIIFGMHNLPKFPLHTIIHKNNIFASASVGMIFTFKGSTSHAAHPENGKNPSLAIAQMIQTLYAIPQLITPFNASNLITIIHVNVGEIAFGTSAGSGRIMATFRSHSNAHMETMKAKARLAAENLADTFGLDLSIEEVESFSATHNSNTAYNILLNAIKGGKFSNESTSSPFPWSEDFGFFTDQYEGCYFGIGSGKSQPQLHNSDYDFPDAIIPTGIKIFEGILEQLEKIDEV